MALINVRNPTSLAEYTHLDCSHHIQASFTLNKEILFAEELCDQLPLRPTDSTGESVIALLHHATELLRTTVLISLSSYLETILGFQTPLDIPQAQN